MLLTMVLITALGMALTLVTTTESRIASLYGEGMEAFYAADALVERVASELSTEPDWSLVLDGSVSSTFSDGPEGLRTLSDGTTLDLVHETARVNCGKSSCTNADLEAISEARPWGANNPRWRVYASGPLSGMSGGTVDSRLYLVAWVGDDPSENDGFPLRDGDSRAGENPGLGRLSLLVQAYGAAGVRRAIAATVVRGRAGSRILTWRERR